MQVPPIYCVKCRRRTPNRKLRWNRAGRQVAANCSICGIKKLRFVSRGATAQYKRRRRHG